ncbi:Probable leucine-rich repeat receptor-like serine/threonine-protein kinase [Striga hermonthica]|uniref:Probable leucine-rich repeat receptor-like serine/threonine-protein kinase n=1 Tax=Striga hermonthica TaxID=68872 RepID=A0A9N7N1K4_STRHE|nr:Probable leucine-rich repeat receptor-like serine/threonine-protein kinase [Striga hermonthica]
MVRRADLVIIGISVGLAVGVLTATIVFLAICWYRKRTRLSRCTTDGSAATLPIRPNGLNASIDSSASLSKSLNVTESYYLNPKPRNSWWTKHGKDPLTSASASGILRYNYKDIQKGTGNFTAILGQGSFGPVYKATMPAGEVFAVKVLASNSKQGEKEFQTETNKNMLKYVWHIDGEQVLSWEDRLQIALDISHGIEYLHDGAVPPVVHRDLKSANILLDNSMRAKVADFGLSKERVFDGHSSGLKGTYGYIDPMYISTSNFTEKSDVYSFGIILFEIITSIHPHQNLLEYVNLAAMSPDGVDEIIDTKIVGTCNVEEVRNLAKIAHKCLHQRPRKRPSIGEVSQAISRIIQRRLVKEGSISFASGDFSRVVSGIEMQQMEIGRMTSIDERVNG